MVDMTIDEQGCWWTGTLVYMDTGGNGDWWTGTLVYMNNGGWGTERHDQWGTGILVDRDTGS